MSKVRIPIIVPDDKQLDDFTTLSDYTKRQINGVVTLGLDQKGEKTLAWENRPGLSEWIDLGESAAVDGLFWWVRQQTLVATCNGKTFFIDINDTVNEKTGTATMLAGTKPSYADVDGTKLFQASSGKIGGYAAGATNDGAFLTDAQAPTNVTHLTTLNRSLVALSANSQQIDWSETNLPEDWGGDYATVGTMTDLAKGLYSTNSFLIIPGQSSLEVWRDDGTAFVRELQGYIQAGIIAVDSFTIINDEYFWLTENKEVVRAKGKVKNIISNPYAKMFKNFTTVSDAVGSFIQVAGKNLYLLDFPTEGYTFVYDVDINRWFEWGAWSTSYTGFIGRSFANCTSRNIMAVGSKSADGKIYKLSQSNLTDASTVIRGMVRTDELDHSDPENRKFCNGITFKFKKSEVSSGTASTIQVRYRDNGEKSWSDAITVTVEESSTSLLTAEVRNLGSYFTRQWEFAFNTSTDVILIDVVEDVHG